MAGLLVGVVGPSGVGKDSVMEALAARREGVHLVRRVITRPAAAGGERFDGVDEAAFAQMVAQGQFVHHWRAHGLRYGIPVTELASLEAGTLCLVNLSRSVLSVFEAQFDQFVTLLLTAPAEILATRLAGRGRESAEEIERRLARAAFGLPDGLHRVVEVPNTGALDQSVDRVLAALGPYLAPPCQEVSA